MLTVWRFFRKPTNWTEKKVCISPSSIKHCVLTLGCVKAVVWVRDDILMLVNKPFVHFSRNGRIRHSNDFIFISQYPRSIDLWHISIKNDFSTFLRKMKLSCVYFFIARSALYGRQFTTTTEQFTFTQRPTSRLFTVHAVEAHWRFPRNFTYINVLPIDLFIFARKSNRITKNNK